jgi:bifunctional polynucleotide phosphatase/kinase
MSNTSTASAYGSERTVASFFTPTSQKKPEKITWRVVNSVVIGKYTTDSGEQPARREKAKVAAFDLVSPAGSSRDLETN